MYLGVSDSAALQLKNTEIYVSTELPKYDLLQKLPIYQRHSKIRIGYYSADFYRHATSHLMAGLFELHDKEKFELFAFSFGPNVHDEMRQRISLAFNQFIDVTQQSDLEVAQLSRKLGIHIAIDLKGLTQDSRLGIFSYRAAPIQVSYLGYPGSLGAEYIDYLIADKILIPELSQANYVEKIVYLPNSYQVNDRKKVIADIQFTKNELGLPSEGFVFCCFNSNYKITPEVFNSWVKILKAVEGSVLWLFEDNPSASANLRKEAKARGLDSNRLIFAQRMPLPEHLARHKLADLFLDTYHCNAHTTASDALWAGLPVLTWMGESFASRVAGSLLNALDLSELITTGQADYEHLAIDLSTNSQKLNTLKNKLNSNQLCEPLFNTPLFAKHIEAAYTKIFEKYQADSIPDHIYIDP
jgi:predicted O-linked N-acetylglucosamine transferase (SPINDLY family)